MQRQVASIESNREVLREQKAMHLRGARGLGSMQHVKLRIRVWIVYTRNFLSGVALLKFPPLMEGSVSGF